MAKRKPPRQRLKFAPTHSMISNYFILNPPKAPPIKVVQSPRRHGKQFGEILRKHGYDPEAVLKEAKPELLAWFDDAATFAPEAFNNIPFKKAE